MNGKNLVKNIVKFAAIALGVFLLAQAVTAKPFYISIEYSNYNAGYDSYIVYNSTPVYYNPAPVVSYDYYYPPLYDYGTYYADAIGGYPFGGYYNTYSPYYNYYPQIYSCVYCYDYYAYPSFPAYPAYAVPGYFLYS